MRPKNETLANNGLNIYQKCKYEDQALCKIMHRKVFIELVKIPTAANSYLTTSTERKYLYNFDNISWVFAKKRNLRLYQI